MNNWQIILAASSAIILFLFGIDNFSKEIQKVSGEKLRKFLIQHTTNPLKGLLIGGVMTSLVQSSTATSVIAVGLVNAGIITFKNSLGIIFGANIGTTITAQLIAFKLTAIAPYFIIIGFFTSLLKIKYSFIGKSIFYFGFVFFSLNIVSGSIEPLQHDAKILNFLTGLDNFFIRILAGLLFTAVVQSSSVTTGIAVILVQQSLLDLNQAIPIVMGANIGTTITAILASINMDNHAKKTAYVNTIYNIGGVIIFTPIVLISQKWIEHLAFPPAETLANFHFIFNVVTSVIFIIFIKPLTELLNRIIKDSDEISLNLPKLPKEPTEAEIPQIIQDIELTLDQILIQLKDNYFLVSISIEAKEEHLLNKCKKYHSFMIFLRNEISEYCARIAKINSDKEQGEKLIELVGKIDYLYQINDSLQNLIELNEEIIYKKITLSLETILCIREVSTGIVKLFDILITDDKKERKQNFENSLIDLHTVLTKSYKKLLKIMTFVENEDATPLARFLSVNQRLKDKLHSLIHLL
ncbi:MAG: hypothetical protein OHK0056_09180 [Bacteriovoracaceae bacterium]